MMKKMVLAAAMMVASVVVQAAPVVFNFDDLTGINVPANYMGATWTNFGVTSYPGASSGPNIAYNNIGNSTPTAVFSYAAGFTSLNFTVGVFSPGTFSVYDGVDGTGALLGSLMVTNASPNAFIPASVIFSGVGRSVVVSGGASQIGWDDVTINANDVPEPASLALVGLGLVGVAAARRKARK